MADPTHVYMTHPDLPDDQPGLVCTPEQARVHAKSGWRATDQPEPVLGTIAPNVAPGSVPANPEEG